METTLFNTIDILIVPIVLIILFVYGNFLKKKQAPILQKYFTVGLILRMVGTFLITLITQLYYGYGDTYLYYQNTIALRKLMIQDPLAWVNVLFTDPSNETTSMLKYVDIVSDYGIGARNVFKTLENASVSKIGSIINIICFDSYLGISLFVGLLSFLGCWFIFKTFTHIYPGYEKQFAWYCLYLPSLWFWGSGLLKDPICLFALGILLHSIFIKHSTFIVRIAIIAMAIFLLLNVKAYIFYSFAIAFALGISIENFKRLSMIGKGFSFLIFLVAIAFLFPIIVGYITDTLNDIITDSKRYVDLYESIKQEGDSTIIPILDPTPFGFFKFCLEGLWSVFMKPYLWNVNKPIYLFVAAENLLIWYIIFRKIEMKNFLFMKNYRLLTYFSISFFIVLGIIVGTNAFNLGTVSRYRIPTLPFFFAGLFTLKLANSKKNAIHKPESVKIKIIF